MGRNRLPPGFRFEPTDIELVKYYLKRKILGKKLHFEAISEIDIYKFAPWDLPEKSCLRTGDLKWYFFCPRRRKYASGARTNRATDFGCWKTTGKDRCIIYNKEVAGWVRTLIFHVGKAPKRDRTDWVMYEYWLEEKELADEGVEQNAYVLCSIFKKNGPGPKNGAQYGAPFKEEDWVDDDDVEMNETYDGDTSSGVFSGSAKMLPIMLKNSVKTASTTPESMGIKPSVSCPFGNDISAHLSPAVSDASFANMEIPLTVAKDNNVDADLVPQVVRENNNAAVLTPQVADDDDFDALLRAFLDEGPSTPIGNGESSIILNGHENNPHTPGGNYKIEVSNKYGSFEAPVQSNGDDFCNGLGDLDISNGVAGYSESLNMKNHDEVDEYLSLDDIERPLNCSTEANCGGGGGDVQNGGFNGDSSFHHTSSNLQDTAYGFNADELLAWLLGPSSELPNEAYGDGNQLNLFDMGVDETTNRNNNVGWERETTPFNRNTSAPP